LGTLGADALSELAGLFPDSVRESMAGHDVSNRVTATSSP
jgi:hypothetical protein